MVLCGPCEGKGRRGNVVCWTCRGKGILPPPAAEPPRAPAAALLTQGTRDMTKENARRNYPPVTPQEDEAMDELAERRRRKA